MLFSVVPTIRIVQVGIQLAFESHIHSANLKQNRTGVILTMQKNPYHHTTRMDD